MVLNPQKDNRKILFIHGFASSGQSAKAEDLAQMLHVQVIAPDLLHQPLKDMQILENILLTESIEMIVGSSLGGFYALILALRYPHKLILINPSLHPQKTLSDQFGYVRNFKGDGFYWMQQHINELEKLSESLRLEQIKIDVLQKCLVLLAEQDERLNYQEALHHLQGAQIIVDTKQDHRFSNILHYQQQIEQFFLA